VDAERLEQLTDEELAEVAELVRGLEAGYFPDARPEQQLPPADVSWKVWLLMAGRGWGKTRTGAEATAEAAVCHRDWQLGLGAATLDEARDVCIEGHGGLLEILDRRDIPHKWNRSLFELQFLETGSKLSCFSGEDAESWRGPNFHWVWCDELAKWAQAAAAWDVLYAAVRAGETPRIIVTTTPKPMRLLRRLRGMESTYFTGGASTDNVANLAPGYVGDLRDLYGDTPFARQEIEGVLLDDETGLLFDAEKFRYWHWIDTDNGKVLSLEGRLVDQAECVRFCTIDLAAKLKTSRDWTVMAAWAITAKADLILLDRRRAKITERQHFSMLSALHGAWNLEWACLEKSMYATELVKQMTKALPEVSIRPTHPELDKVTRAVPASVIAHDGRLWLPEHARWAYCGPDDSFVDECVDFPPDPGKGGHDDQVDTLAYAAREVSRVVNRFRRDDPTAGVHPDALRRRKFKTRVERERRARRPAGYWQ
jgi:predicted phage terminase large subunit-like protein